MDKKRELRNARAAIRGFNAARGKRYLAGDEADLRDLLTALMVLANTREAGRTWSHELYSATMNYEAESKPAPKDCDCTGQPIPDDDDGAHAFNANGVCLRCGVKDKRG